MPLDKIARWFLVGFAVALVSVPVAMAGNELLQYSLRSPSRSERVAAKLFTVVHNEYGYSDLVFEGPAVVPNSQNNDIFRWSVRDHPNQWIQINLSFLPYGVEFSFSHELSEAHPQRLQVRQ